MKALVVAGGVPQIELIKQLKSRGIVTVLADGNSEAVARPYADKFYRVDIFDIPAVKIIAEKEQVDFVLTVCADQVLRKEGISCFNIFLYADLAYRVAHAAELDENKGFTGNALVREVEKKSAGRATYYKHYTGKDIHSLSNYHICLDVGEIGVEKCREIILDLVTKPE